MCSPRDSRPRLSCAAGWAYHPGMRTTSLTLFLLGVICSSVVGQAVKPKTPNFVICEPDRVVLYPSNVTVSTNDLKKPGNALDKFLAKVETNKTIESVVVFARPKSAKCFKAVRTMIRHREIEWSSDVLDANAKPDWDSKAPRADVIGGDRQPVFFECRGYEVFFIDKEWFHAQIEKLLDSLPRGLNMKGFLKMMETREVENEFYKVNLQYLETAIIVLEARPSVHGDAIDTLNKPDGKYQKMLSQLKPGERYIAFKLRDDSFQVFRKARAEAKKLGFDVGWELLAVGEPIKFGAGGSQISVP